MSDAPQVHTGQPLVPISDDDVAYRTKLAHWTLTEALFLLSGYRPPGYESTRHMQDHFWTAYNQAVISIEIGDLCRKIERAGEPHFIERPVRWLAWADSIGPEHIKVDERVRRALSQKAGTTVPTADASQPDATTGGADEGKAAELPELKQDERRPHDKQQRIHDVQADALLENRINAVKAKAKNKWPDPQTRPGVNRMARQLVDGQPKSKVEGFGQDAIRKILAGTYKPAKNKNIPGLSTG